MCIHLLLFHSLLYNFRGNSQIKSCGMYATVRIGNNIEILNINFDSKIYVYIHIYIFFYRYRFIYSVCGPDFHKILFRYFSNRTSYVPFAFIQFKLYTFLTIYNRLRDTR